MALPLGGCAITDDEAASDTTATPTTTPLASPERTDPDQEQAPDQVDAWSRIPELIDEIQPSVVAVAVTAGGRAGEGSGVIVDADGLVVTNAHVVVDASDIEVVLVDGTRLDAEVLATDEVTDLALLTVERDNLPAATLADTYPRVGELVVAVGNPLGFDNTATAGIVSGIQRSVPGAATAGAQALVDLIQTDAAISPGNSGGALVTADGSVIGITVAYIPPALGAVNLGFAIPAPTVSDVVDDLLDDGTANHAYLGLQLATVTPQVADQLGLDAERGAAVLSVESDGPADDAELEEGDIITGFDGEPVDDVGQLLSLLRGFDPGDEVTLTVVRDDDTVEATIVLGNRPASG